MKKKVLGLLLYSSLLQAQLGVGTPTPQETFHVNGSLQVTNGIFFGGDAYTKGSSGLPGQVLKSNGPDKAPSWGELAGVPKATGTVIAVDGTFIVAQEITVQMTSDFRSGKTTDAIPIGNLNNEIIDNEDSYIGNGSNNSFQIFSDGIYQVTMNMQLQSTNGTNPVVGIWDDKNNTWLACVNDVFVARTDELQTFTLITSIKMLKNNTYSFRVSNGSAGFTIKHLSSGGTGSGPVTQICLKRLR
ncbi:hypothetical protein [Flavobacterium hercynium]|uniref:C1q domain-containing protein n=1 Tax=Flavobacterium hercynium TaxID=387094 RepID=A0A226HG30_9FLAO|nr:hypothetical protein [Flavobacterium hercynium]OXA93145.1 hypothetical protein B0A66_07675 [Flavobacterium hercynium]SMP32754.1 hypothetical protein SAMN06265346_11582 [Flavobacterium hercynium]